MHASIARLLTPQQLTPQQIEAVQASVGEEPSRAACPARLPGGAGALSLEVAGFD